MPKQRKNGKRDLRPVFYVFCEGEKTEPYYLEHYVKNHCAGYKNIQIQRIKLSDVWSIAKTNRTDPVSLVTLAVRKGRNLRQRKRIGIGVFMIEKRQTW